MIATIHDMIEAHVRTVRRVLRMNVPGLNSEVDVSALRCVLRRQAEVLIRAGYEPNELSLCDDGDEWWCVQVVPCSVVRAVARRAS